VIERVLSSLPPGGVVLDGGCGPGQVSALADDGGYVSIGVDLTPEMLAVAARRRAHARLICGDLCRLSLADASCDAVICWFAIHNLPRSLLPTLLTELHRVLRSGGRLLLATHSGTGEEWFESDVGEGVVCTYYGRDELKRLLSRAGFVDVSMHTREPRPHEHQVQKLFALASA
jgi:ubiquinone/menaquinone biosynthesis C-methylase UbiE